MIKNNFRTQNKYNLTFNKKFNKKNNLYNNRILYNNKKKVK